MPCAVLLSHRGADSHRDKGLCKLCHPVRLLTRKGLPHGNEPHMALAANAFDRIPDRALLYRQLASLNPPFTDVGLGELSIAQEDLEGFSIPTLVIAGAQDRTFSLDVMTEVSQAIPAARFHFAPDAGHSPYF